MSSVSTGAFLLPFCRGPDPPWEVERSPPRSGAVPPPVQGVLPFFASGFGRPDQLDSPAASPLGLAAPHPRSRVQPPRAHQRHFLFLLFDAAARRRRLRAPVAPDAEDEGTVPEYRLAKLLRDRGQRDQREWRQGRHGADECEPPFLRRRRPSGACEGCLCPVP